jgi:DNA mismatch repair protein MutS2
VLLADIEAREAGLTERERLMQIEQGKTRSRIATVSDRENKVRDREREVERDARQQARKYLLEARSELERAIAEVRAKAPQRSVADAEPEADFDDAARAARRSIEEAAADQSAAVDRVAQQEARDRHRRTRRAVPDSESMENGGTPTARASRTAPLETGDSVLVSTLGNKVGRIVSVRAGEARVAVGSMTLAVPIATLTRTDAPPPPAVKVSLSGSIPDVEPMREVDIRGLRGDEIDDKVLQALDTAIRADLREVRIIHGKGTGALRKVVKDVLSAHPAVASHEIAPANQGGDGATVALLRGA